MMRQLAEYIINNRNFIKYAFSTDEDHTYMIWRTKLAAAADYLEANRYEDYMTAYWEKLLYSDVTKIYEEYHGDRDNSLLYPLYISVLKLIEKLVPYIAEHTGVPFICLIERNGHKSIDKYISFSKTIKLPEVAEYIEPGALRYCHNMTQLEIGEGIKHIPLLLDAHNTVRLKKLTIPASAKSIDSHAFEWCRNLEDVVFKGDNTRFTADTFRKSIWFKNLEEGMLIQAGTLFYYDFDEENVAVPEGVKYIAPNTFQRKSMKTLQLPQSLEMIDESAFEFCNNLEKLVIPHNVTKIANNAFYGCGSLAEIHLPKNIDFERRAFLDCKNATVFCYRDTESVKMLKKIGQVKIKYID